MRTVQKPNFGGSTMTSLDVLDGGRWTVDKNGRWTDGVGGTKFYGGRVDSSGSIFGGSSWIGGRWTVDGLGRWDGGRWTVDGGRWTVDGGRWTVDGGR